MKMLNVTRIYTPSLGTIAPVVETGITLDDLLGENIGYENFAHLVWEVCSNEGMYDDSDQSSNLLCIYVAGDVDTRP